jgi:hypothetical protein
MKKILGTIICFGIICIMLSGTITVIMPPVETGKDNRPQSAALTVGDWQIGASASFDYCRRMLSVLHLLSHQQDMHHPM